MTELPAQKEYVVLGAPGWPGGFMPVPNTEASARQFVKLHGGRAHWRWTSEWVPLDDGETGRPGPPV